jgi:predicted AlkP superfamily phosphohydrolase/phosphomutase
VTSVYERLDAACGALRAAYGEDALCVVVSDHGSGGAARRVVHLNRWLETSGFLARKRPAVALDGLARRARDLALALLPPRIAEQVFRRSRAAAARVESAARFGGIDWRRSVAFSEEANTQPGIWVNVAGREACGVVAPSNYERVRDEIIDALGAWRLPGGAPVIERAWRREEIHAGPHCDRAPDIVLELALDAGYGLSLVPTPWSEPGAASVRTLDPHELAGGRGRGMNGTHRPLGIWMATGPGALGLEEDGVATLADAGPTLLRAMGIPWDGEMDGIPMSPVRVPYTPEEEERVARRLRALGYLE